MEKTNFDIRKNSDLQAAVTAARALQEGTSVADAGITTTGDVHGKSSNPKNGAGVPLTNASGVITFSDLDLGVYLVTEQAMPVEENTNGLTPANPFLVFVPMTNSNGEANFDPHVYPKNDKNAVNKTVYPSPRLNSADWQRLGFGDQTTDGSGSLYLIEANVPQLPENRTFDAFSLIDDFSNATQLEMDKFNNTSDDHPDLRVFINTEDNFETGTEITDYTVSVANNTMTIEFGEQARTQLSNAPAGSNVYAAFVTNVQEGATGEVNNAAGVSFTDSEGNEVDIKTDEDETATTQYAQLEIVKVDQDDNPIAANESEMEAVFELYRCSNNEDPLDPANRISVANGVAVDDDANVVRTSGDDGSVTIPRSLPYSPANGENHLYCINEIKAPQGYQQGGVLAVAINEENLNPNKDGVVTVNFKNVQIMDGEGNTFLPMTGGNGIWWLIALALLLLGGGGYLAYRNSKKSEA